MRRTEAQKRELLSLAIKLMKQGKTNKEISQKTGVTERALGRWLRPHRKNIKALEQSKSLIIERLNNSLHDKQTSVNDIIKLLDALKKLKTL